RGPDVWNGGWGGRPVSGWAADRVRTFVEDLLDGNGCCGPDPIAGPLHHDPQGADCATEPRFYEEDNQISRRRSAKPADDSLRPHCRAAVYAVHHLRHDMGRALPAGGARV